MPIGIVETALVLAAAKGAQVAVKKRQRRGKRRQFFATQHATETMVPATAVAMAAPIMTEAPVAVQTPAEAETSVSTDEEVVT